MDKKVQWVYMDYRQYKNKKNRKKKDSYSIKEWIKVLMGTFASFQVHDA